ncbi:hypothetical protein TWF569_003100 [Orbilia oligospora]|uniref:Uncharacterized protein n=1 Tax=Orbilia oligospora TaxID=2813651 RepID=A0A7C8JFW6_ORBOL|nr:hypothetical protein TWF569_003100 [Orbilia oligospora]KAF3120799.1 hypothetical protein TWF703_002309 [Orbilia oligospora]KAF3129842.1 hypothetical protein TWF594_010609 [Orbilia oligospora]
MTGPLESLNARFPCRERQIDGLAALLGQDDIPAPPVLVLYGTEATGKSTIVKAVLEEFEIPYAYVSCKECITARHVFEKAYTSCDALISPSNGEERGRQIRPDSVNALAGQLQKLIPSSGKIVLVLDAIDKQREVTPTMLSGLARIGEVIKNLTVIMIVTVSSTRLLNISEPPSIYFPAYNKEECVKILSLNPKSIFEVDEEDEYSEEMEQEDRWLWAQCCSAVWDIMGKYAARNLNALKDVVEELWPSLIQPIVDNEYGTRDFPKLFNRLKNEKLRNSEESYVSMQITRAPVDTVTDATPSVPNRAHDLPYFSKYLLCAAYLASFNTARYDTRYFSKLAEGLSKRKRGRKKKNTSRQLNRKHLGPRPFQLERMMAIFQSILPSSVLSSVDIGSQIATLNSLRLIRKVSNVASATDASSKWRVNVGYEYVKVVGRSVKFDLETHLEE